MNETTVGAVVYDARISTSKLRTDGRNAESIVQGVDKSGTKSFNRFAAVGVAAFAAVTAAATAMAISTIKDAIDLGESINAVQKTFGDASKEVLKFGESAATAAGLSKSQFNAAVVPIGAMLQNVGFSADLAAEKSIKLATRAADLASVFNTDLSSALTAIQAGLRGEADPLERFGVGLSETNVKAYALRKGIIGIDDEMTTTQKTTARLGLLFEQTTKFAGDFADTSDEAANKNRILQARIQNLSADIGLKLLPVWEALLTIGQQLVTGFEKVSTSIDFKPLIQGFNFLVTTIQAVISTLQPVFGFISENKLAMEALKMTLIVVGAIIGGIILIIGVGLVGAFALLTGVIEFAVLAVEEIIKGFIWFGKQMALTTLKIIGFGNTVRDVFIGVWNTITSTFSGIAGFFGGIWNSIKSKFVALGSAIGNAVGDSFKNAINSILGFVESKINDVINTINSAIEAIDKVTPGSLGRVGNISIPRLAEGGIVKAQRGGILANIGEGGQDEAVIPLDKMDDMFAGNQGGDNITINLDGIMARSRSDLRAIATDLIESVDEVRRAKQLPEINGANFRRQTT